MNTPTKSPIEVLLQLAFGLMRSLMEGLLGAFGIAAKRAILPIEVRSATPDEVLEVRHRVLREGRPRSTAVFDGDSKATTRHWVAQQSDRVVGVVSVMARQMPEAETPQWQLRGMAVLPELQGQGLGRALLTAVNADVRDTMWCNARAGVEPFYEHAGWVRVGEAFDIEGIGPHVRMTWSP